MYIKDKHEHTINVPPRFFIGKQLYNLRSDASFAKCDVISGENQQFKLKYLINKTIQRKSKKETIIFVS